MELFVVGTFWFWILTIATLILITGFERWDQGVGATVCFIVYLGLLQFYGDFHALEYLRDHRLYSILIGLAFFVVGTVWASLRLQQRWEDDERHLLEGFRRFCTEFNHEYTMPVDRVIWLKFETCVKRGEYPYCEYNLGPAQVWNYLKHFCRLASFWPVDMLYTLLHDFVWNMFKRIFFAIADQLQAVANKIYYRKFGGKPLVDDSNLLGDTNVPR